MSLSLVFSRFLYLFLSFVFFVVEPFDPEPLDPETLDPLEFFTFLRCLFVDCGSLNEFKISVEMIYSAQKSGVYLFVQGTVFLIDKEQVKRRIARVPWRSFIRTWTSYEKIARMGGVVR